MVSLQLKALPILHGEVQWHSHGGRGHRGHVPTLRLSDPICREV
jgi:hypothetical protein